MLPWHPSPLQLLEDLGLILVWAGVLAWVVRELFGKD